MCFGSVKCLLGAVKARCLLIWESWPRPQVVCWGLPVVCLFWSHGRGRGVFVYGSRVPCSPRHGSGARGQSLPGHARQHQEKARGAAEHARSSTQLGTLSTGHTGRRARSRTCAHAACTQQSIHAAELHGSREGTAWRNGATCRRARSVPRRWPDALWCRVTGQRHGIGPFASYIRVCVAPGKGASLASATVPKDIRRLSSSVSG